jgi:predicted DsbA family dithiol-disulfide isomerase
MRSGPPTDRRAILGSMRWPGWLLPCLLVAGPAAASPAEPRAQVARVEHRAPTEPPSLGPRRAPVTIELFFVPGVASSNAAYGNLVDLQKRHPRRVRLVFRPLERQGHLQAPEAALEAHVQGRFFDFMDAAIDTGRVLREREVETIATELGLDLARIRRAWADERHRPALEDNERRRLHHRGRNTPEMLLNGVPAPRPVGAMGNDELEEAYREAFARASELIADGVATEQVAAVIAAERTPEPVTVNLGPLDDVRPGAAPPELPPQLLRQPLDLTGLPGEGPADAAVPIAVFCNLRYHTCVRQVSAAAKVAERFPDQVRVVWSPWSDETADDAAAHDLFHRAALCAEAQDAGWRWVDQALSRTHRSHGRWNDPHEEIQEIDDDAEIDGAALARCVDRGDARAARRRVEAAKRAGITHGPAVVVGGRIYLGGLADMRILQALVEDELAPGLLERAAPGTSSPSVPR